MRAALLQTPSCCSYWAQAQKDPFIHSKKENQTHTLANLQPPKQLNYYHPFSSPKAHKGKNNPRYMTFRTYLGINV